MTEQLATILGVAGLFAAAYGIVRASRVRHGERVHCPLRQQEYDTVALYRLGVSWELGKRVDVVACSAFDDATRVDCEKSCLQDR